MTTEVTFYTHPSTWSTNIFPNENPYNRVAGINFEGEELWTDTSQLPRENSYRRTDTEALSLSLPRKFAHSVVDYFHDFYADPPRFYQISDVLNDRNQRSNCHRFGITVASGRPQRFLQAYRVAAEVARVGEQYTPDQQKLGTLAVLAAQGSFGLGHKAAIHTMVSLGDTLPNQYLHTVALGGNLAISPLEPYMDVPTIATGQPPEVYAQNLPMNIQPDPQIAEEVQKLWG